MSGPQAFGTNPYAANRQVAGELVTILTGITAERGLVLEGYRSRAVLAGSIHELMVTDENAQPGGVANRVGLIGFFVVRESGVLLVGAPVVIDGRVLGTICGFNDTHMLNHQNICVNVESISDGLKLGMKLGNVALFGDTPG
jgi:hypothetical protein